MLTFMQDERAKRDRDRAKWNTLMDEIAKLKIKVRVVELLVKHIDDLAPEWRAGSIHRD